MVESDGLENRCTLTGTVGSNPTLSANNSSKDIVEAKKPDWEIGLLLLKGRSGDDLLKYQGQSQSKN